MFKLNDRATMMERVIDDYMNKRMSLQKIIEGLNARHTPCSCKGKRWMVGMISQLLRQKALMGTCTLKGVEYPDYYPALIDKNRWNALQEKLNINATRKTIPTAEQHANNLFASRCKCKCGGNVGVWCPASVNSRKYNHHNQFFCSEAKANNDCKVKDRMHTEDVEMDFFLNVIQEPTGSVIASATKEVSSETTTTRARLTEVEKAMERCVELTQVPNMPLDKISAQLADLEKERVELKNQLAQLNSANFTQQNIPSAYVDLRKIVKTLNLKGDDDGAYGDYDDAARQLQAELKDQNVRKQLVPVLATIVERVDFDLEGNRYRVTFRDGRITNWREVDLPTLEPFPEAKK